MHGLWQRVLFAALSCTSLAAQQKDVSSPQKHSEPTESTANADSVRLVWTRDFVSGGASSIDVAKDVSVDATGNIYVTGKCETPGAGIDYLTVKYSSTGQELWRALYDGEAHGDDIPVALKIDGSGNVLVTGMSASPAQFAPGEAGVSQYDYVTVKYNSSGNRVWVARYNGPGNRSDIPTAMVLDAAGNVYVTGQSDVDSAIGRWNAEIATVRYSPGGHEEWVSRYPASNGAADEVRSIATDDSGNVYVGATRLGYYPQSGQYARLMTIRYNSQGTQQWVAVIPADSTNSAEAMAVAVARGDGVYMTGFVGQMGSAHTSPALLAKYNFAGQLQWLRMFPDTSGVAHRATTLKVDGEGNVIVAGVGGDRCVPEHGDFLFVAKYTLLGDRLWNTTYQVLSPKLMIAGMDVNTGGDVFVTVSSQMECPVQFDGVNVVSLKYSSSGSLQWSREYQGGEQPHNFASAIVVDNSGGVVVVGGSGGDNQIDFVTLKYQPTGVCTWVAQASGTGRSFESIVATTLDATGNLYVLGSSVSRGLYSDYITTKFDPNGNQLWAARYNNPSHQRYNDPNAIAVDASGNVFVTGYTAYDAYSTVKYNAEGDQLWAQSYHGEYTRMRPPAHLGLDRWGNAYVGGWAGMVKYNRSGVEQWDNWQWPVLVVAVDPDGNSYISPGIIRRTSSGVDSTFTSGPATDIAVDDSGNVYLTSSYNLTPGTFKLRPSGETVWTSNITGDRLILDRQGNVFVGWADSLALYKINGAGVVQYRVDLRSGLELPMGCSVDANGNIYAYGIGSVWPNRQVRVIKYGTNGSQVWQAEFQVPNTIGLTPHFVNVDRSGNVYVVGNTELMDMATTITIAKLEQITVSVRPDDHPEPASFALNQNYPNPFNPTTTIRYSIPAVEALHATSLRVYDLLGREVATLVNGQMKPGSYAVTFDGSHLASGIYFYRLEAGGFTQTRKLLLLR